ncbi:MAG: AlwI family type II restriction endonuclease [Lachnospiraceae bacterium]|nr:AlwI family type II restriction endonuclease [Lachnospiraceae bacterium]
MAYLKSKTLFFTTSPRSPLKMIPEIEVLHNNFEGKVWNTDTQVAFIKKLVEGKDFEGQGSGKHMALSARDRITRAPKALGFVDLKPVIKLTKPGEKLISGKRTEEILLRQLLKFQLPSPYHKEPEEFNGLFGVKPYLEIFRLIYELGALSFDELMIFGMQLTHYTKFELVVGKIREFRKMKAYAEVSYKTFKGTYLRSEVEKIYKNNIDEGNTKTRESRDLSLDKFVKTKASNMRDYADACFRYLRATGLVEISQRGHSISIMPEKRAEVEYFLNTIEREPVYVEDEEKYKEYLFNTSIPVLYSDDRERLLKQVVDVTGITRDLTIEPTEKLKDILEDAIITKKIEIVNEQIRNLKEYKNYADVITVFDDIKKNAFYDVPLMLEWNTWRAMTMLDGGEIKANLKLDDKGQPMSTAPGNMADIICDYGDFGLAVEVTMQSGQKQYEMEGESVSRHLAKLKKETGKEAYCLFIAPKINASCIAYFYALHTMNIAFYGGKSVIVPLELDIFINMVEQSCRAGYVPNSKQVKEIFEYSIAQAKVSKDENEWYAKIKEKALNWL